MEEISLGNAYYFRCPVKNYTHNRNPVYADTSQIKIHLISRHDYKEYQESAFENKLIPSKMFRSRVFFVNLLADYGKVMGAQA